MIVLALLLQAAPAAATPATAAPPLTRASAAPPERFSILLGDCARAAAEGGHDVVVCGSDPAASQHLPLPNEAVPDHGVPSNPFRTGSGALAATGSPCATLQGGCQVGFGPPIMPMIAAGVKGVGNALANRREAKARARDGSRRQPIDLNEAPVGRLEP